MNCTATTGDGLYEDAYEEGKCTYRGENPNNYIKFNDELWRIMAIEPDKENPNNYNLKIMKKDSIGKIAYDEKGTRSKSTSTYCVYASTYSCNAWAATSNIVGTPSEFTLYLPNGNPWSYTSTTTGTVAQDASLNTYLNGEYYGNLGNDKKYIVSHKFNIACPGNYDDTESMADNIEQEAFYQWNGKIALMTITEVFRATSNEGCNQLKDVKSSSNLNNCRNNNWMWSKSADSWTLTPFTSTAYNWFLDADASYYATQRYSFGPIDIYPVLYLDSNIRITGEGTETDPYTVH